MQVMVDKAESGKVIALVGLAIQLCFFAIFAFIAIYVHRSSIHIYQVEGQTNPKKKMFRSLYITLILLYVRSVYRVTEYAGGREGPIAVAEWAFYVFDGLAISLSFVGYCVYFMGDYLPKRNTMYDRINSAKVSSISSLDNLTHAENDIEMCRSNNMKYNHNNV